MATPIANNGSAKTLNHLERQKMPSLAVVLDYNHHDRITCYLVSTSFIVGRPCNPCTISCAEIVMMV